MVSDDYSIDSYSFFDPPSGSNLVYSGKYKSESETDFQPITYGETSGIYLNDTNGMTFGVSTNSLSEVGNYNIILYAENDEALTLSPTLPSNFTENTTSTKRSQQFDLIVIPNTTLTLNYDEPTRKIEASINKYK